MMQALDHRRRTFPVLGVWLSLGALVAALAWVGASSWYRNELARSERELAAGNASSARQRLERLSFLWSSDPEFQFLLGACHEAEGQPDAALEAWARVPKGSSPWIDATVRRAQLALERGRFANAEAAILSASFPPGHPAAATCEQILLQLYLFTIRYDEI